MSPVRNEKRPLLPDVAAALFTAGLFVVSVVVDVREPRWLTVIALVLLLLAVVFVVTPFFHLTKYGKPNEGDAFFATTRVVDKGVYSVVRHPQYLGYTLLVLGFGFLDPHPLALVLAGGAAVFFYLQCIGEERYCRAAFGDDYNNYMKRVPRINFVLGLMKLTRKRMVNDES